MSCNQYKKQNRNITAHPTFTIRYMFEFRVYSPTLKTTFFYGREPSFEQAWDKAVVYILNDARWKDQSNIIDAIAATETKSEHATNGWIDVSLGRNMQNVYEQHEVAVMIDKTARVMNNLGH